MQPIFIGDVQGCADEFDAMISRARASFGEDFALWIVGDLVNRGPHNLRALHLARELVECGRAHYVLGNHEVDLLRTALGLREQSAYDSFGDVLATPDASEWVDWLRRRPLVETGRIGAQRFAMLHAATHPDWTLEALCERARAVESHLAAADLERARRFLAQETGADDAHDTLGRLTHCRSVTDDGRWSSQIPADGSVAWHRAWSLRSHPFGIVYGHWALQGLHVARGLRGLDTGCVHHGRGRDGVLTAWVPDGTRGRPFDVPDGNFWQIPARRVYYAHRDAAP
jgi:bis(5'-nucleosyl)-tetraphosphatase (symmetrical)